MLFKSLVCDGRSFIKRKYPEYSGKLILSGNLAIIPQKLIDLFQFREESLFLIVKKWKGFFDSVGLFFEHIDSE